MVVIARGHPLFAHMNSASMGVVVLVLKKEDGDVIKAKLIEIFVVVSQS